MILSRDINIVISAEAGQGVDTAAEVLLGIFKKARFNVFSYLEYMSRVRGGCNSALIRVSSERRECFSERIDILVALDKKVLEHLKGRISDKTIVFYKSGIDVSNVECAMKSELLGNNSGGLFYNILAVGALAGLFGVSLDLSKDVVSKRFTTEESINKNISALTVGYENGVAFAGQNSLKIEISKDESIGEKILISGNDSLALGFISGGCNFISAYPMSPSTGVFTFLSTNGDIFNIVSEQAEDEIAAANIALGAWYAGARAMVSTAGGGFALMCEAVSLCGMIESPMVFHVAQRPAPATGLPTRTEQADLNLVLYAGHGEFPRIILAPGNPEGAFELGALAFDWADKFQVPVFVLSDQYLIDSTFVSYKFKTEKISAKNYFVKTHENYKRYALSDKPFSPRGIPNFGDGLVCVDSDEHNEEGCISENLDLRTIMVQKRLDKLDEIKTQLLTPELFGAENYKFLIVGWGSNYGVIKEVIKTFDDMAFLYFKQIYPLHSSVKQFMQKAKVTVIVENNATAQFASLIKLETGEEFDFKVLKYNGMPFSTEELQAKLKEVIG